LTFASVVQVLLSGLQIGSIYALLALSYYVIIIATGILNFAQGEWMMVSGVLGVTFLSLGLPYSIAFCGGIVGATALAIAAERLVIRPLQKRQASEAITLLALFGIMLVVRYGTGAIHGRLDEPLPGPAGTHVFRLGSNVFVFSQSFVIYGATAAIFLTVALWMRLSWLGRSLRITAIDPLAAVLVGVNLNTVRMVAFGVGGLIAAAVAWLYAPLFAVGYLTGAIPGIKGFIALFIGGTGSPLGPLVGGLLLGVMEVAAARYLPSIYAEGIAFGLLMIILFLRPSGLIGARGSQ
jgi:branched-chain amino acid transport system permease protein